ncbi:hypothetical protein Y1Q_0004159 [Alligator mississippiensis]|uniref:Uncharacterized protein n=1 Tax=Alligator mississippiensis TaxID=8496 RepID=A0A151PID7_ALLMI|nr:hypothetical protein Y1Q_0004159 [Alligator mississippiensis]
MCTGASVCLTGVKIYSGEEQESFGTYTEYILESSRSQHIHIYKTKECHQFLRNKLWWATQGTLNDCPPLMSHGNMEVEAADLNE